MSAVTPSSEQAAVINAPISDDVLVVAGAGSGKTFTMTQRIIELIHQGVAPERILGLTFTRKAAGQLLDQVSAAVCAQAGEQSRRGGTVGDSAFLKPSVFTYDAFFQTIVRQYGMLVGFDQSTQPLSEAGALQLATEVIDGHMDMALSEGLGSLDQLTKNVLALSSSIGSAMIGSGCDSFDEAVERVRMWDAAFIERVQHMLEGHDVPESEPKVYKRAKGEKRAEQVNNLRVYHCAALLEATRKREALLDLVAYYSKMKRERNMAEFQDFTIAAYQLVKRFPSIGERVRRRYTHVLLDEYQDTSTTQASLLAALFRAGDADRSAVTAVGDPFQSIYAWRGASPGAFRIFQRDFHMPEHAHPFPLPVTRRNPRIVLEAANDLTLPLRREPTRPSSSLMHEVDVVPLDPLSKAPEGTLGVLGYATSGQEVDGVVRFCRQAIEDWNNKPDDEKKPGEAPVAILFRAKKRMPEFLHALGKSGLRASVVGYSALLQRPEVRDVLALLHVAADHTDSQSLMRLLATPRFGVCAHDLGRLAHIAEERNVEERYGALVQAGLADADLPRDRWGEVVKKFRNQVPNAVFLIDVLLRDDLEAQLGQLSEAGRTAVLHAAAAIRYVQLAAGRSVQEIIRAAIEALDLDIDTILAGELRMLAARTDSAAGKGQMQASPTIARMPLEAIVDLADAYMQEIAPDQAPTLRGFMAWVDHLRDVEDEAANLPGEAVDVELMTIHQAKGLQWEAVAVVGMATGDFPSSGQETALKIEMDPDHAGGHDDGGRWRAPEYRENAKTWLSNPTAVPVPMRVDAGMLPRFPHDADIDADPVVSLDRLNTLTLLDDEVFGTSQQYDGAQCDYLTQCEEYGRRLHADERRLAYVALTRTCRTVLLTYAGSKSTDSRDPLLAQGRKYEPSVFWQEVHDALLTHDGTCMAADCVERMGRSVALIGADGKPVPAPKGYFVGDQAGEYCDAVVGRAWSTPLEAQGSDDSLPWPASISPTIIKRLHDSAECVRQAMQSAAARMDHDADRNAPAKRSDPLYSAANALINDHDLMGADLNDADLDEATKSKAKRLLANSRRNVTGIQALAGETSKSGERPWRGIVRPIPHVASPSAQAGTQFHDWAERFVLAGVPDWAVAQAEGNGEPCTREALTRELEDQELHRTRTGESHHDPNDRRLLTWKRRLVASSWARRTPVWAERFIVVNVPGVGIVNGKLDAVFAGGLDPHDASKRFTVVDWKTGHRPDDAHEVRRKLFQLDMYRLLLSEVEGVELDSIDAVLYYVSERDEGRRELRAGAKTKQEIIAEARNGIPEQSDND